ncbi:MAG: transcription initiation protein [Rhodoglobus sp.]
MTHYLISFPSSAMDHIKDDEWEALSETSHAVVREAKAAGVYVFGGGIDEDVAPVRFAADGSSTSETYPETRNFDGGFLVLKLPTRGAAEEWAAKVAAACRCDQELRQFQEDPES